VLNLLLLALREELPAEPDDFVVEDPFDFEYELPLLELLFLEEE
jgi:hypothetical protein